MNTKQHKEGAISSFSIYKHDKRTVRLDYEIVEDEECDESYKFIEFEIRDDNFEIKKTLLLTAISLPAGNVIQ